MSTPESQPIPTPSSGTLTRWRAVALLFAVWALMFVMRVDDPSNLMDNDQQRPAAYAMDVAVNGQWIVQHDDSGDVASKPPLYPWLAGLSILAAGRATLAALYLPCGLATLAMALGVLYAGGCLFGQRAGLLGAMTLLLSFVGFKEIALARSDTVFAACVFAGALLAWRAWNDRRSWTPFWVAMTLATLAKGPLGIVLAASGLIATRWEKPEASDRPSKGGHLMGLTFFFLLMGGWFAWAYAIEGRPLIDKLIGRELVGHAVARDNGGGWSPRMLLMPSAYFVSRFAPWSLLVIVELWRAVRRADPDARLRRAERYWSCYLVAGVALFSLFPHQRPDHLFPLMPAAAMLAGRALASLPLLRAGRRVFWGSTAVACAVLGCAFVYYEHFARLSPVVKDTKEMADFAHKLRDSVGADFPLIHEASPYALQFFLGTMKPSTDKKTALAALSGEGAAFVVVSNVAKTRAFLSPAVAAKTRVLLQWPKHGMPRLSILGNRDRLERYPKMAACMNGVLIEMDGMRLEKVKGRTLLLRAEKQGARVTFVSTQEAGEQRVLARVVNAQPPIEQAKTLAPNERWTLTTNAGR